MDIPFKCLHCDKWFFAWRANVAKGHGQYCSHECQWSAALRKSAHNNTKFKDMPTEAKKAMLRERQIMRTALNHRIRKGLVKKIWECQRCLGTVGIVGHHTDYSRPEHLFWVCRKCHSFVHKLEKSLLGDL